MPDTLRDDLTPQQASYLMIIVWMISILILFALSAICFFTFPIFASFFRNLFRSRVTVTLTS